MQVLVQTDPAADASNAEYVSGIIVAPGRSRSAAFITLWTDDLTSWIVEFDEPFFGPDGSGPHASAEVRESYLRPAPFADDPATIPA